MRTRMMLLILLVLVTAPLSASAAKAKVGLKDVLRTMDSFQGPRPWAGSFLSKDKKKACLRFKGFDMIRTRTQYIVQKSAKNCRIRRKLRVFRKACDTDDWVFGGFARGHLLLISYGSSDIISLQLFDVRKGISVITMKDKSPLLGPGFDTKGHFTYWSDDDQSLLRGKKAKVLNANIKKGWPAFQKKHPGLKKTSPPLCTPNPGPGTFRLFWKMKIPLSNIHANAKMAGKVKCISVFF